MLVEVFESNSHWGKHIFLLTTSISRTVQKSSQMIACYRLRSPCDFVRANMDSLDLRNVHAMSKAHQCTDGPKTGRWDKQVDRWSRVNNRDIK